MAAIKEWCAARPKDKDNKDDQKFPPVTGELRKLTVCSASTLLERFDSTMRRIGRDSLVKNMSGLRLRGFNAHHFVEMVTRKGDPVRSTALDKLRLLTFGSPALRFVLHHINTCFNKP